jgi:hypothetical protein
MRILHVSDCAGVGAVLAKYQRQLGHESCVAKFGNWDGRGIDEYYNIKTTFTPQSSSVYKAAKKGLPRNRSLRRVLFKLWSIYPSLKLYSFVLHELKNYDVLHIHGSWGIALFLWRQPHVLEFHGDDVRKSPSMYSWFRKNTTKLFVWGYAKRNKIYVSTPDLLDDVPNGIWIPNIADTDHFNNSVYKPKKGTALYSKVWYETGAHAQKFAEYNDLELTVLDRKNQCWIDFRDFPEYMGKFEYYIDRQAIHSLSKTALEALAIGCKVVDYNGKVIENLPSEHLPLTVAKYTIKIYEEKLNRRKRK